MYNLDMDFSWKIRRLTHVHILSCHQELELRRCCPSDGSHALPLATATTQPSSLTNIAHQAPTDKGVFDII